MLCFCLKKMKLPASCDNGLETTPLSWGSPCTDDGPPGSRTAAWLDSPPGSGGADRLVWWYPKLSPVKPTSAAIICASSRTVISSLVPRLKGCNALLQAGDLQRHPRQTGIRAWANHHPTARSCAAHSPSPQRTCG